jgi:hypothetical protein
MPASLFVIRLVAAAGVLIGAGIAYWQPRFPLLVYWLVLATGLGIAISTVKALVGLRQRAKWLVVTNAVIVAFALATTQLAARRAISSTHLRYQGVLLEGVRSFTIGAGGSDVDVRLLSISVSPDYLSIRVSKGDSGWTVEPLAGIEQLRLSTEMSVGGQRDLNVAQSTILRSADEWVAIVDPTGVVVDTLRLVTQGRRYTLRSSARNEFLLAPINGAIEGRYRRQLRNGTALSALDGQRAAPSPYERFVRLQELPAGDVVNGVRLSAGQRAIAALSWLPASLRPARPLIVSASPPFSLRGDGVRQGKLTFTDSALVEVRNGETLWRFQLRPWRREPSADVGLGLFFVRNPRPLDTPLPAGVNCTQGAACGAISLRRLPPPIAHVSLDFAGFDPERYGMLGRVEQDRDGFSVVFPRRTVRVERSAHRPVAVPVTSVASLTDERARPAGAGSYWVLLAASGISADDVWKILFIGVGLALLLAAIYTSIASAQAAPLALSSLREKSLSVGITAILALLVARVIVGARVAFFAPFYERGIETAIGMWVAIAVVAVGLLSWSAWLPPLLASAANAIAGHLSIRRALSSLVHLPRSLIAVGSSARARAPALLTIAALGCLALAAPVAVLEGVGTGVIVLLAWVCVAWVAAFAGPHVDTFERGAWSVVEHLPPRDPSSRIPEVPIILACFAAEFALFFPRFSAIAAGLVVIAALYVIRGRRHSPSGTEIRRPDRVGVMLGVSFFVLSVALLRSSSENGSMAAFLLVVLVALASVRIGRGVTSAANTTASPVPKGGRLALSLLLLVPVVFLLPLALIDMGLFLVMLTPIGFATLLAVGHGVGGRHLALPIFAFALLFGVLARQVLFRSVDTIRDGDSHAAKAAAFDRMTRVFGVRPGPIADPLDRVAARSVAKADRQLSEELLVAATPGPARDLLIPSIEQIWGAAAYAGAGPLGVGLGQAVIGGRGVAEAVSYAENTFSVFVLAEHGAVGGLLVLALYLLLVGAVGVMALSGSAETPASYRASRALFLVAALIVAIPACYVALSNLGLVPITGQNMPFLGLNAWSDVAICAGVVGILITGAMRGVEEMAR